MRARIPFANVRRVDATSGHQARQPFAGRLDTEHGVFTIPGPATQQIFSRGNGGHAVAPDRDRRHVGQDFREQALDSKINLFAVMKS